MTEPQFSLTASVTKRKEALQAILVKANAALFLAKITYHKADDVYTIAYGYQWATGKQTFLAACDTLRESLKAQGYNVEFVHYKYPRSWLAFSVTPRDLAAEEAANKRMSAQQSKEAAEEAQFNFDKRRFAALWPESTKTGPQGCPTWIAVDDYVDYARPLSASPYDFKIWRNYDWHRVLGVYPSDKRGWEYVVLSNPFGYGVPWRAVQMFSTDRIAAFERSKPLTDQLFYRFHNSRQYTVESLDWIEMESRFERKSWLNARESGHIEVNETLQYPKPPFEKEPPQWVTTIKISVNGYSNLDPTEARIFADKIHHLSKFADLLNKFSRPRPADPDEL